jgi:N-glycosylase/DNA lyase
MSLLNRCKLGFRAERIKTAAEEVCSGELDFDILFCLEYKYAREHLMRLHCLGEKVADCVLLLAFEKMESFPVDTPVRKIIQHYHIDDNYFETCANLSCTGDLGAGIFRKLLQMPRSIFIIRKGLGVLFRLINLFL